MLFVASPWLLLIVSLSLILSVWLIRVSACSPWVYFVWESLCFLDLSECLLSHIRKFLTIISSNIFSCPLFSFWTTIMQVLEKALAPHSSTLTWKLPWMEEPGRLQSMGSLRVRHEWATSLSLSTFMHWRRKWQPTPVFLPGGSQGWRTLMGCHLWGCTESDTTEAT